MEGGIGSRTGRPSSRYGSAPVFTGPVRRWQKQWVHMSQSSSVTTYSNNSNNNNNNNIKDNVSAVRVRRWTPVQEDDDDKDGDDGEEVEERPRRRKIRYAPIVMLEGKKKEVEKGDDGVKEVSKTNKSTGNSENEDDEKKSLDKALAAKNKASEKNVATEDLNSEPLDLDMDMGDEEDHDLGGAHKVADWVKAAQRGFAH